MTQHSPQLLDENLFTLFQRQAQRRPRTTAVIDESGACSYGALEAHASAIAEHVASADESGVSGTPTFFINGRRHHGAYDIVSLSAAVRAAREVQHTIAAIRATAEEVRQAEMAKARASVVAPR